MVGGEGQGGEDGVLDVCASAGVVLLCPQHPVVRREEEDEVLGVLVPLAHQVDVLQRHGLVQLRLQVRSGVEGGEVGRVGAGSVAGAQQLRPEERRERCHALRRQAQSHSTDRQEQSQSQEEQLGSNKYPSGYVMYESLCMYVKAYACMYATSWSLSGFV